MQVSVKQDREKWLGGSDVPIIMGISPFTTRFDLLLFKAGLKENEFKGNEYTEYGNVMESKIRDYINELYKTNFVEGKHEFEEDGVRCHTDGENNDTILEIKTTSQLHDNVDEYKVYLVQLLFYMHYTNRSKGVLAVYKRPEDFDTEFDIQRLFIYEINKDDYSELIIEILEAVERFKSDLIKVKENPLITEEELQPKELIDLSNQLIEIEKQLASFKEIEKKQKKLKDELYDAMVKYGVKKWETPNHITITRTKASEDKEIIKFNEEKFKEKQPLLYSMFLEKQIQKGKKGYIKITNNNE